MPYIKRNELGQVCAVSLTPQGGHIQSTREDAPELELFLEQLEDDQQRISGTDMPLVRVLEDLIDLLIDREVIRFTDLPDAAQNKLLKRRHLRAALNPGLDLLDDSEKSIY